MAKWPYPDLRNGTTLHHITDSHVGKPYADWRTGRMIRDMERLRTSAVGHVHSGDVVNWSPSTVPEDNEYLSFRANVQAVDGQLPWLEVVGNHDTWSSKTKATRTPMQWAHSLGKSHFNTVCDMGDMRIIGIGPDQPWDDDPTTVEVRSVCVITVDTIAWLDEQLTLAGSRPCVIVSHAYHPDQFGGNTPLVSEVGPKGDLYDVIAAHDNAVMWLTGHMHTDPASPNVAKVVTVGARKIFALCGPATGGRMQGVAQDPSNYINYSPCLSTYVTYLGDAVDVRWRDHLRGNWWEAAGDTYRHILLTA